MENNTSLTRLDLSEVEEAEDIEILTSLTNLQAVDAFGGPGLRRVALPSVTWLKLHGFAAADDTPDDLRSLAFLGEWMSLRQLILLDSGLMTDLDALSELPKLELIHLRGSKTKRAQWPKALQDKLNFVAASYEFNWG